VEERRRSIVLVAGTNLLQMPGRRGTQTSENAKDPTIEESPE
jgi:hypothetical protein